MTFLSYESLSISFILFLMFELYDVLGSFFSVLSIWSAVGLLDLHGHLFNSGDFSSMILLTSILCVSNNVLLIL